jgi:hypothetical protein
MTLSLSVTSAPRQVCTVQPSALVDESLTMSYPRQLRLADRHSWYSDSACPSVPRAPLLIELRIDRKRVRTVERSCVIPRQQPCCSGSFKHTTSPWQASGSARVTAYQAERFCALQESPTSQHDCSSKKSTLTCARCPATCGARSRAAVESDTRGTSARQYHPCKGDQFYGLTRYRATGGAHSVRSREMWYMRIALQQGNVRQTVVHNDSTAKVL